MSSTPSVTFTKASAERIAAAVRFVEGQMGYGPGGFPPGGVRTGDDPPILLGKTTAAWAKGTTATIPVYSGPPGSETATGFSVVAMNKFTAIGSGKWVILAGPNQGGVWYLISAECS